MNDKPLINSLQQVCGNMEPLVDEDGDLFSVADKVEADKNKR